MARFDQYIGLNAWAKNLVGRKEKVRIFGTMTFEDGRRRRFTHCKKIPTVKSRSIGTIRGAWTPVVSDLKEYRLPDGRTYIEFVQAAPWHGGPNYFIALKDASTGLSIPESLWSEEDIR